MLKACKSVLFIVPKSWLGQIQVRKATHFYSLNLITKKKIPSCQNSAYFKISTLQFRLAHSVSLYESLPYYSLVSENSSIFMKEPST